MQSFVKWSGVIITCAVGGILASLWLAGGVGAAVVVRLLSGVLVLATFAFLLSIVIKMPCMEMGRSLVAFAIVLIVTILMMEFFEILDVQDSLTFSMPDFGIPLNVFTADRHHVDDYICSNLNEVGR